MAVRPKNHPSQLYVEGIDDLHAVIHLLGRHGADWDDPTNTLPRIKSAGGVKPLLSLVDEMVRSTATRTGIVLDANGDLAARWQSLRDRFAEFKVELPDTPAESGTIVPGRKTDQKFGIWIMPDNKTPGALEDFLATLIPSGDSAWGYAEEAVATAVADHGAPVPEGSARHKARIHTWLAWREEPGHPYGTAIKAESMLHESPEATAFVEWFCRLYDYRLSPPDAATASPEEE